MGKQTSIQNNTLLECFRNQHVLVPQTGKQNEPPVISLINAAMTHFLNYPAELDVLTARDISAAFDTDFSSSPFLFTFYCSCINLYIRHNLKQQLHLCFKWLEITILN